MRLFFLVWLLIVMAPAASADSDTFVIEATITGSDTTPPTIPGSLTATPVTATQITVSWSASADNIAVGGYQVFRDSTQIATTTLTTYIDTGLASSTFYGYEIVAFDTSFNYATATPLVATTTLAGTTTPIDSGGSGGGSLEPVPTEITDLMINADRTSAAISFSTNVYTQADFRWGRTPNYELGYIGSDQFKESHQTVITDLTPGTVYELQIVLTRRLSGETLVRQVQFTTQEQPDSTAPLNVTNVQAVAVPDGIEVAWQNPIAPDFSHVRIVSSDTFYPIDDVDGWLVYEGAGTQVVDTRPLERSVRYYTVFSYDEAGNHSSGAVVTFVRAVREDGGELDHEPESSGQSRYDQFSFADLTILQQGSQVTSSGVVPVLVQSEDSVFSISYERLPEYLKTIVVTITPADRLEKSFSFLLRINAARDAYQAVVGPLPYQGSYVVEVAVYDHESKKVARRSGDMVVVPAAGTTDRITIETVLHINWPLITISTLLLLGLAYSWYRYQRPEDNRSPNVPGGV